MHPRATLLHVIITTHVKNKCPRGPASSNSVAVKNKPARVLLLRLHSTQHLLVPNRVGLHSSKSCWVKTPLGNSVITALHSPSKHNPDPKIQKANHPEIWQRWWQQYCYTVKRSQHASACQCTWLWWPYICVAPSMRVPLFCHQVKPVRRVTAPEPSADDCCTQSSTSSAQPTQAGDWESVTSSVSTIIRHSKIREFWGFSQVKEKQWRRS